MLLATLLTIAMNGGLGYLPNSSLTPGDVLPNITKNDVCAPGYTRTARHVPTAEKKRVFARYQLPWSTHYQYEVDHLVPLELGGSNSVTNLWPQPFGSGRWDAEMKDRLEDTLHAAVCSGTMTLQEAQTAIRSDWTRAYERFVQGAR